MAFIKGTDLTQVCIARILVWLLLTRNNIDVFLIVLIVLILHTALYK